jgi:glycosyltransferase involved in cell wall biosynthesis
MKADTNESPRFSICITHYNNVKTVREALESLFSQIDERFEVVLVDNESNDGSYEILRSFGEDHSLKLLRAKCTRGRGRQIAFEESIGRYVISNIDMDDVLSPGAIGKALGLYESKCDGQLLWIRSVRPRPGSWGTSVMIAPRPLIAQLGGWRNVNVLEDRSLAARAAKVGLYRWTRMSLHSRVHVRPRGWSLRSSLEYYFCLIKLGGRITRRTLYHRLVSFIFRLYFRIPADETFDDLQGDFDDLDERLQIHYGGDVACNEH